MKQRKVFDVEPLVRLSSGFTQVHMPSGDRDLAVADAYYRTLSSCEWVWTPEQQARMAQYCLWASQRIEAFKTLADGCDLIHEPPKEG